MKYIVIVKPGTSQEKIIETAPGELTVYLRAKAHDGERCKELIDAADEMTRRLYCVVDWLALHPEYNPKTKVIPKKDYPVLVDVTF